MTDTVPQGKKEISIAGEVFVVSAPYAEGHILTAAEASAAKESKLGEIASRRRP